MQSAHITGFCRRAIHDEIKFLIFLTETTHLCLITYTVRVSDYAPKVILCSKRHITSVEFINTPNDTLHHKTVLGKLNIPRL